MLLALATCEVSLWATIPSINCCNYWFFASYFNSLDYPNLLGQLSLVFQPMRIHVAIYVSRFKTKQKFQDGGRREKKSCESFLFVFRKIYKSRECSNWVEVMNRKETVFAFNITDKTPWITIVRGQIKESAKNGKLWNCGQRTARIGNVVYRSRSFCGKRP